MPEMYCQSISVNKCTPFQASPTVVWPVPDVRRMRSVSQTRTDVENRCRGVNVSTDTSAMDISSAEVSQPYHSSKSKSGFSVIQSVSQSISQSTAQSLHQPVSQSPNQSSRRPVSQSVTQTVSQSISQSVNQTVIHVGLITGYNPKTPQSSSQTSTNVRTSRCAT